MFELLKIRNGVNLLLFNNNRDLCMTFLRYQDYYENINDKIRGKKFTLVEQMGYYVRDTHNNPNALWTYNHDWGGFNIPLHIIKEVHDLGIEDPNCYDYFMKGIYTMIMMDTVGDRAYLIGTTKPDPKDSKTVQNQRNATLEHEITHAMFYLDEEYKTQVLNVIDKTDINLIKNLSDQLKNKGYPDRVINDEINAYLTTGDFFKISPKMKYKFTKLKKELKKLRKDLYSQWEAEDKKNKK